ncbi:hypothetical protein CDIK_0505 [Cucumispora dikerogammari]|nr:hypothetical protein CDIK_0505 [Cucumispora dikerogammari]
MLVSQFFKIISAQCLSADKNNKTSHGTTIRSKVFDFKFDEVSLLIKETTKFDVEDLPYVYFLNKYFNETSNDYGKYLVGCNSNPILTLMSLQQYESLEGTTFINKVDIINASIEEGRKISTAILEKKMIFKPKIALEALKTKINIKNLERLALNRTKEGIQNLVAYLNTNLHIAYQSEPVLLKLKTPSAYGILGQIYLYGINVNKNISLAKHYFTLGANQGDINCLNGLGDFYKKIKKQPNKALNYYMLTTQKGSKEGLYKLKKTLVLLFNETPSVEVVDDDELYLPELFEELILNVGEGEYEKSCKKLKRLLNFSEKIQEIEELNVFYFHKKEYDKCFILTLFLQECGSQTALIDLQFLYGLIGKSFNFPNNILNRKYKRILSKTQLDKLYFRVMNQYVTNDTLLPIAECYSKGIGTPINNEIAFAYWEVAKKNDNVFFASLKLLNAYEFGIGVSLSIEKALSEVEFIEKNVKHSEVFCFYKKLLLRVKLRVLRIWAGLEGVTVRLIYIITGVLFHLWLSRRTNGS